MGIYNITILTLITALGCSTAEFERGQLTSRSASESSEAYNESDGEGVEIPVAIAGGIYLFSCSHENDSDVENVSADCSVIYKDKRTKVNIERSFKNLE